MPKKKRMKRQSKNYPSATNLHIARLQCKSVRLACVRHAASVHPEPGSNSHVKMVFVSCQFYLALFTVNSGSLSIFRSTCLFLNFSENLGIFRVALLFICQGAVLLIGSISRRTFVPVVQTAYLVYHKQFCLSRTFFILFSSFFRNPVAYHSQQQFSSLSELAVRVKQFFHLFFRR